MPWGAAIAAGGALLGGAMTSSSNEAAAQTASDASLEAARIQAESIDKQIEENRRQYDESNRLLDEAKTAALGNLREGAEAADLRYEGITGAAAAGPAHMRGIIADPGRLTPVQQEYLDDLRSSVNNQLRGSSFAGSGRTAAALLRNTEDGYVNSALEANRNRADSAAAGLTDVYFGSEGTRAQNEYDQGKSEANIDLGIGTSQATNATNLGTQVGNAYANQGAATAAGVNAAGQNAANAQTANAAVWGQTIGDVGSVIAAQMRDSRYSDGSSSSKKG